MLLTDSLRYWLTVVIPVLAMASVTGCSESARLARERQAAVDSAAAFGAREQARSDSILAVATDGLASELPHLGRHAARQTIPPLNVGISYGNKVDSAAFEGCAFTVFETLTINESPGHHTLSGSLSSIDIDETRVRRQPWDGIRLSNVLWDVQVSMVRGDSASSVDSDGRKQQMAWISIPVRDSASGERIVSAIADAASACNAPRSAY